MIAFASLDHPRDEFFTGRDIVDHALDDAGGPDPEVGVAILKDLTPAAPGHQLADVLEGRRRCARSQPPRSEIAFLATRAVLRSVRKMSCVCALVVGDDLLLDRLVDRRLDRAHEAGAHVDRVGAERQRGDQAAGVAEAARGDDRDRTSCRPPPGSAPGRDVVLARVAGALEAVDRDGVDAERLGLDRVADRRRLVDHLDAVLLEVLDVLDRVGAGRLDDLDAGLDDRLAVLRIGRRGDRGQDRQVDAEGLVGQLAAAGDLLDAGPLASAGSAR